MPLFNLFFLGSGWPWFGEFDGFINNVRMFPNPTEFGILQTPHVALDLVQVCPGLDWDPVGLDLCTRVFRPQHR